MSDKKAISLNRAVALAAKLFLEKRYEDVSIREVASASHCSSDTIYAVFGCKENLFIEAISRQNNAISIPDIHGAEGPKSLQSILNFAVDRIRFLAHPHTRAMFRAVVGRAEGMEVAQRHSERNQTQIRDVVTEVNACIAAKLLRPYDPAIIAYNIFSGVAYEPMTVGQLYGNHTPVYIKDIIRNVFTPLVTKKGNAQLVAFLPTVKEDITATSKERPYYLWQHFSTEQAGIAQAGIDGAEHSALKK